MESESQTWLSDFHSTSLHFILKLKCQYFGHRMWRADSLEKILKAARERNDKGQDGWMVSLTERTWVWASSRRWWRTGSLACWVHGITESQTWLSDWKTTMYCKPKYKVNIGLFPFLPLISHSIDICIINSFSQWCHPTRSSSVIPFSSCLQSFPASGSFPMSQFFPTGG